MSPDSLQKGCQPMSQVNPSALDSDESDVTAIGVALCNFMSNAGERAPDRFRVQDQYLVRHKKRAGSINDAARNLRNLCRIISPSQSRSVKLLGTRSMIGHFS